MLKVYRITQARGKGSIGVVKILMNEDLGKYKKPEHTFRALSTSN